MPSREEIEALRAAEKEVKEHEREERIKQYRERVANRTGSEIAVEFDHVSKTYKLYKNDRSRFLDCSNAIRKSWLASSMPTKIFRSK